ncbi:MAG: hypothetical protein ACREMN_00780 [Gemmatimonadales bacterium]
MADKEKERDWDREMREVDKLLAKLPDADPMPGRAAPPRPPQSGVPTVLTTPVPGGRDVAATWLRLTLAMLLGIGMLVWPYTHVCGAKLFLYMLGIIMLIVAGVWAALASWRARQGWAHLLALLAVWWGLSLMGAVVLPRVGYAGQQGIWFCPEPPTQLAPTPN